MPEVIDDLRRLVSHASVSFPGFPDPPMQATADAVVDVFHRYGFPGATLLDVPRGHPLVCGVTPAPAHSPTVLLYAHYDVQPVTDLREWSTDPWTLIERDGRLYGRGAADNKSGILMHAAALRLLGPTLPVGIRLVIEGDEEAASHLEEYVVAHPELFQADVMLVADMGNEAVGRPVLISTLRGEISVVITVRTLHRRSHSGAFGGPVPDAMMALVRILDSFIDENGDVAIADLHSSEWLGLERDCSEIRRAAGMLEKTKMIGTGSPLSHLLCKPSATIIGIDAPSTSEATNSLLPSVRAKVSFRITGARDADAEVQAVLKHIRERAPFGAEVEVEVVDATPALAVRRGAAHVIAQGALTDAFGVECRESGSGASIPLLSQLAVAVPNAEFVLFGAEDEEARVHDANESVDIHELQQMILAEALMLQRLAEWQPSS